MRAGDRIALDLDTGSGRSTMFSWEPGTRSTSRASASWRRSCSTAFLAPMVPRCSNAGFSRACRSCILSAPTPSEVLDRCSASSPACLMRPGRSPLRRSTRGQKRAEARHESNTRSVPPPRPICGHHSEQCRRATQRLTRKGALILGGAHGSLEIARSLGRRGIPVWLVTADNPLASLSRFVERSLRWNGPREDDALTFLTDLVRSHGLDGWVLFAGSDDDVWFVAQNHAALSARFHADDPCLGQNPVDATTSAPMNARADELGIAHPLTRHVRSQQRFGVARNRLSR